uniref:VWFD domain-containing protein n=1 Tax=Accipiter nisus TaxID=211598 RepID=A0A8B9N4I6_9AVES
MCHAVLSPSGYFDTCLYDLCELGLDREALQQCGCWHNGQHYPVGSEFWTDNTCSSKCTCPARGSKVQCSDASCPAGQYCGVQDGKPECLEQSYGICHVHSDPHYNTFDKVTHHFMGNCTYTLAKVCSNTTSLPYFNVEAENESSCVLLWRPTLTHARQPA